MTRIPSTIASFVKRVVCPIILTLEAPNIGKQTQNLTTKLKSDLPH